jgi:hypothetical protein
VVSFRRNLVHTVTVVRAPLVTDRYGNSEKNWANATRRTTKGWVSQQGAVGRPASLENIEGREAEVSSWMVYFMPGEDVTPYDRIEWEGKSFEVEGPTNPAYSARTRKVHHIEARIRAVEG